VNATKERQAWCCLQVKLCGPCPSTLCVPWCKKALYKYSSFPFPFLYSRIVCNCDVQKDLTERYVKMNEELKQTKVSTVSVF